VDRCNLESEAEVTTIGVLLMCVGMGLLISAGISCRMARSLGVMDKANSESRQNLPEK
jgi:hypothetical protein